MEFIRQSYYRLPSLPPSLARFVNERYNPVQWLRLYYPLYVAASFVHRSKKISINEKRNEIIISAVVLSVALCHQFVSGYFKTIQPSKVKLQDRDDALRGLSEYTETLTDERSTSLQVDLASGIGGLKEEEVLARRAKYGTNILREKTDWIHVWRTYLIGPSSFMTTSAFVISIVMQNWIDTVVLGILFAQSTQNMLQSVHDYERSLSKLEWDHDLSTIVLRAGQLQEVSIKELVPDDIVYLSPNSIVPADVRLFIPNEIVTVDQSYITGEALCVNKSNGDTCFLKSAVRQGDTFAVVVDTGARTKIGYNIRYIDDPFPKMPAKWPRKFWLPWDMNMFYGLLQSIGMLLLVLIFSATIITSVIGEQDLPFLDRVLFSWLSALIVVTPFSYGQTISRIRERGVERLAEEGILDFGFAPPVNIESLGTVDTLCVDMTGCITEVPLVMHEPQCLNVDAEELMLHACLTISNAGELDPLDDMLLRALKRFPDAKSKLSSYRVLEHTPWGHLRSAALVEDSDGTRMFCVKGAPKVIFNEVESGGGFLSKGDRERYMNQYSTSASKGFRSIGIARRRANADWELLGTIRAMTLPFYDSAAGVRVAKELGISVKMFSNDSLIVHKHRLREIGLNPDKAINCNEIELEAETHWDETLVRRCGAAEGFAESFTHKLHVVRMLKSLGHVVAVTGDSHNDVEAMTTAHCSIALNGPTHLAFQAASLGQHPDVGGFASIIRAVQTSRQTWQQVHDYVATRTIITVQHLAIWVMGQLSAHPLHLGWLVLNLHFSDLIMITLEGNEAGTLISEMPVKWSATEMFITVLGAIVVVVQTTFTTSEYWLFTCLTGHWLLIVLRTRGRVWQHRKGLTSTMNAIFAIGIAATSLCLSGLIQHGHKTMSVIEACQIWKNAIVAIGTICLVYNITTKPLVERQLIARK